MEEVGLIDFVNNWRRWFEEGEVVKLDSHICDSSDWVDNQPTHLALEYGSWSMLGREGGELVL